MASDHEPPRPERADTAADAPRQMQEVLRQLSHDIRSAMSDVIGGLRLVDLDRLDPQTRTQMRRVRAAADTLAALVDDALMTAAGEAHSKLDTTDLILADWLDALGGRWRGRAAERGSNVSIVRIGTLPSRLSVAPLELDRIVGNLLGNALIHVPGGDVHVEVEADPHQGLSFRIRDSGAGFPRAVLDSFSAGRAAMAEGAQAGTGLGLRIAGSLSAAIGAALRLRNDAETGGGLAILTIPPCCLDWTGSGEASAAPPDLSGLRVLVAEDNLTNQMILRQMLERMRAQTAFAADGVEALDLLRARDFDIGLIDIEMPRKSGLEVMEEVRASPAPLGTMPLVAITAYVLRDNREAIYAAGADGIIGKPIASAEDFGRAILRHLGRPSGTAETAPRWSASGDAAGLPAMPLGAMDRARFDRLLREAGREGRGELLDRLAEDLLAVRARLEGGIAAGSIPDIRSQTHILIAISGAVGADRLCQLAETLNIAAKRHRAEALGPLHLSVQADLDDLIALIEAMRAAGA